MVDKKVSNKRTHMDENDEYWLADNIEVLKVGTLCSKRERYNIDKKSDERYQVNMIDDKESDEIDQIGQNEEKYGIQIQKLWNLEHWVPRDIYITFRMNLMK